MLDPREHVFGDEVAPRFGFSERFLVAETSDGLVTRTQYREIPADLSALALVKSSVPSTA